MFIDQQDQSDADSCVVFTYNGESFAVLDVLHAAEFRGDLAELWDGFLGVYEGWQAARERRLELDEAAIQSRSEQFRYDRNLVTAEETEQWLFSRGLTLDDFSAFFEMHYWPVPSPGKLKIDRLSSPPEQQRWFFVHLVMTGNFDRLAVEFSRRLLSNRNSPADGDPQVCRELEDALSARLQGRQMPCEPPLPPPVDPLDAWLHLVGRDRNWLDRMISIEIGWNEQCRTLCTPDACRRVLASLRLQWIRCKVETIEFDSMDAAKEACLCVRNDGMTMEEIAQESGYSYKTIQSWMEELPEAARHQCLCGSPGEVFEPFPSEGVYKLWRLVSKTEPAMSDSFVSRRVEQKILDAYFNELDSKYIRWFPP